MCAANFDDHKFVASTSALLLAKGFYVGVEVVVLSRFTAEFGPEKLRTDVQKGTKAFVKGVADGVVGKVVLELECAKGSKVLKVGEGPMGC